MDQKKSRQQLDRLKVEIRNRKRIAGSVHSASLSHNSCQALSRIIWRASAEEVSSTGRHFRIPAAKLRRLLLRSAPKAANDRIVDDRAPVQSSAARTNPDQKLQDSRNCEAYPIFSLEMTS